jgi:phospholipid-translocating ATPase
MYVRLTGRGERSVAAGDIKVGDVIKVATNQRVPADMVFLRTTEKSGACFIRTDQLDGETDWKLRLAVPATQRLRSDGEVLKIRADVYADAPIKDIHAFVGTMTLYDANDPLAAPHVEPLSVDNALWTNTVVASGTAVGLVVYTGAETRSVMNTSQPHTKVGLLDIEINFLAKVLFVLTMALALVLVSLKGFTGEWYVYLFRFVLLFSYIIPISLRVNLDMAKTYYSRQMEKDDKIPQTLVRTSTIPEELGRIRYLLSDKTGTLTQNEMVFKRLHMGTVSFGEDATNDITEHLWDAFHAGVSLAVRWLVANQQAP